MNNINPLIEKFINKDLNKIVIFQKKVISRKSDINLYHTQCFDPYKVELIKNYNFNKIIPISWKLKNLFKNVYEEKEEFIYSNIKTQDNYILIYSDYLPEDSFYLGGLKSINKLSDKFQGKNLIDNDRFNKGPVIKSLLNNVYIVNIKDILLEESS